MARIIAAFLGEPVPVPRPARRARARTPAGVALGGSNILATVAETRAADTPLKVVPGFSVEDQLEDNWCWAALTLALIQKYGGQQVQRQCEIVQKAYPQLDPCGDSSSADLMLELSGALKYFGLRNGNSIAGDVEFDEIVRHIDAEQPVCVRVISDLKPDGHVIAVSGYQFIDGEPYVQVQDPAYNGGAPNATRPFPFATLQTRYFGEETEWNRTYFTKRPG